MKIIDCVEFEVGTPQFRIQESSDSKHIPTYYFYSQQEMEEDLLDIIQQDNSARKISTLDKVCTVEAGDVVFSLISGKATLVRKEHKGYLLTQNYVKMAPTNKIDKAFLIYLINEDKNIRKQFLSGMQGSIVIKYTIKQLKDIILPKLPSLKKQNLIGELYLSQLKYEALVNKREKTRTMLLLSKLSELLK